MKSQNTVSNETSNLSENNNMQNASSGSVNVQKTDTNTARVSNKSDVETNTSSVKHGITGIPEGTKLSDKDLNGFKQSYNETYDIVYQGNIPDNLKPTNIHKVIHYTHEVDDKGNIGYRDNATGKVVLNNWTHDIQSLPDVDVPDITASDGSIYKPIITYTFKSAEGEDPEESGKFTEESGQLDEIQGVKNHEIPDITNIMALSYPGQLDTGVYAANFVITYNSTPAKLNINFVDSKTGSTIGTQIYNGNVGQKVDQSIVNVPQDYVFVSCDLPSSLSETNIAIVKVVKKEISTGDVANADKLPTKNVIIYKNKDGNVVGMQDVNGKAGDKVTPVLPDGYWSDNTADVTIPKNGVIDVSVVKKEISTGDVTHADTLPTVDYVSDTPLIQLEKPAAQMTDKSNVPINESSIIESTSVATGSPRMHERVFSDKISENKITDDVKINTKMAKISENIPEKSSKHTIQKLNNIQDKKTDNNQLPQTGTKNSNYAVLSGILIGITGLLKLFGSSFRKNKGK